MPTDRKEPQPSRSWIAYSGFAFQLLGGIGAAGWFGYWLDTKLALSFPVFMLVFSLGVFGGMLYQISRKLNRD